MKRRYFLVWGFWLLLTSWVMAAPFDMILLLDESGSMLKTDPRGARKDAANLFLRLCGGEHRVGLMGFATEVRVLTDMQAMGPGEHRDWILEEVKGVKSDGQYTDMEAALEQALSEIKRTSNPDKKRAVLLLTDGEVDLDGGAPAVERSIHHIRGDLLGEYLREGVEIYCVAFSQGADRELLEYLSDASGGLCVQGDRDEELQKLFVRLFEEMAQPQFAPVENNRVMIDDSIEEATFLITHDVREEDQVRLLSPDGTSLSRKATERLDHVRWFSAPRYQLITVSGPDAGEWRVRPEKDNGEDRVIILTDVELELEEFQPLARGGERRWLLAALKSDGQVVRDPNLLGRLEMEARILGEYASILPLHDDGDHGDGEGGDGIFGGSFVTPRQLGTYDVEVLAKAPTLERRIIRKLSVVSRWFQIEVEREVVHPQEPLALKVYVEDKNLELEPGQHLEFKAAISHPDGRETVIPVVAVHGNLYTAVFEETYETGEYAVSVSGEIHDSSGLAAQQTQGPQAFHVKPKAEMEVAVPDVHSPPSHQEAEVHTPAPSPTPEVTPAPTAAPQPAKSGNMGKILLFLLILLVLLGVAGALLFFAFKGEGKGEEESMEELRQRAATIMEEEAEQEAPGKAPAVQEEPEGAEAETPKDLKPGEPEMVPEGADLIPLPEDEPADGEEPEDGESEATSPEEEEEEEEMDGQQEELLAEILGEGGGEEKPAAPEEEPAADGEPEPEPEEPEAPVAEEPESMTSDQEDLLSEILGEDGGDAPEASVSEPEPEPEPPVEEAPTPGAEDGGLSDSEADLLAEIMQEKKEETEKKEGSKGTPTIPEEKDGKNDQDAIDDILKQIEGLME